MIKIKNKKQGFMQSIAVLMFSQLLVKILGLVYTLYLTNKEGFGDEGNAIYSSGFQIYTLLLTLSSIGVPNAISKLISEQCTIGDYKGANRTFKIAFATFAMIGLFATILLYFGAEYIAYNLIQIPEATYTIKALAPSIFFVSIASVLRGYFNGTQNINITANSQTLEQLFKALLTIIMVELVSTIIGINKTAMAAVANLATTFATFLSFSYLILIYKNRKKVKNSTKYKQKRIKTIIKQILLVSIPMTLSALMTSINKNIDAFTVVRGLKYFMTEQEAKIQYGILAAKAGTLINVPLSFNIAFATTLVPNLAAAKSKGNLQEEGSKKVELSLLIAIIIALPCTVGIFIFANQILKLLYPNASEGKLILQASSLSIIFTMLVQTINGALQGIGKVMVPTIALGIGVIAKLILNLILVPIPKIGAIGAEISSVICYLIAFLIGFYILNKNIKLDLKFSKYILKPTIATTIMAILSLFIYRNMINITQGKIATIISIIFAIIIYCINIIILKIFNKNDILMLPYGQKIYKVLTKIRLY